MVDTMYNESINRTQFHFFEETDMVKLTSDTREGDFVHENLEMAANKDFRCTARIWYDQTQDIGDGIDDIANKSTAREDVMAPLKHMRFVQNDAGEIVLEYIDGREFKPTDHAWKQMATWMHVSHGFLKQYSNPVIKQNGSILFERDNIDRHIFMKVFQNGYRRLDPDKMFRFRTYNDGTLRAMLSEMYAPIDNIWYLETIQELFKEIGGTMPRLSHWKGDADTMFGNLLIPDSCREESDSDYGGMISLSNCEIGTRRFSQMPSLFRAICMNGCIWGATKGSKYSTVHRGKLDLYDLRMKLTRNIHSQIPLLDDAVNRFLALRNLKIDATFKNVIATLATENRLSFGMKGQAVAIADQFATHEMGEANLFGLINSVTRAGQKYDPSDWVRFDELGGKLMTQSTAQWQAMNSRANSMDPKAIDKVFGIVKQTA